MKASFRRMMALALTVAMILTTMLTGMSAPVQAASAPGNIDLAREVAAEGMVLMENRNEVLPIPEGTTVAMFGRAQIDYVRGGGGSGNTNVEYTRNILQGMQWWEEEGKISLVPELTSFYTQQVTTNGITNDANITITDEVWNAAAAATETAVVTIGRYSSEGSDRNASKGDYYLSDAEVALITRVAAEFENTIVVLNVGAVLDTSWIKGDNAIPGVDAVLMAWQAGMEGGLATADVLLGHVNPSGKFVDTFAKDYSDYPSSDTFKESNSYVNYTEDIFVGYRYFETIPGAAERVNYEFGYGLSYTTFDTVVDSVEIVEEEIVVKATVTNTGDVAGKQVVQVYFSAPRGDLTKPAKELAAFDKTDLLAPGASETLTMSFPIADMSSYDDTGVIQKSAYVMEAGDYRFFVGNSVRDGEYVDTVYSLPEDIVVEQLTEYCSPVQLEKRMIETGEYVDVTVGSVISTDLTVAAEGETVLQSEAFANAHETPRIESFYDDDFNRGFCLAYLRADTWVEYTITPELAGQYKVTMCYANGNADLPNCLSVSVNGLPQSGVKFNAIQTGDGSNNSEWYNFTLGDPFYINLYEGENVVRITGNTNNPNYDYMIFERVGEVDGAYERKVAAEGVTKIEAETFDASIVGRPNSEGTTYPVRIENFTYSDGSAAQCLAYMNHRGNGVEYYINVEQAGQYALALNAANGRAAYEFSPLIRVQAEEGTNVLYRQSISAERTCGGDTTVEGLPDGWYGFADLEPIYIDLPEGNVVLSINAQAAAFVNVDYLTLEKVGEYNAPGIALSGATTVVEAEDFTDAGWPQSKYPCVTETAPETAGDFAGTVCTAHVNYVGNYLSWYLDAEKAGTYTVTLNVANGYDAYTFAPKATVNGKEFPVSISIPSTRDDGEGGTGNRWYNFMDAPSFTVELEEGLNIFTLECVEADVFPNLNSLTFTKLSDYPIVNAEGLTKIEAEAYATTNTAPTENFTAGDYAGQSIGMASRGRYVTYDLYVEEAGTYELALRASNGYAAYDLNPGIIVNGKAYPQFVQMPQTCSGGAANPDVPTGWFTFVDVPAATIELPAGEISLMLLCGNTAGTAVRYPNVDYFTLKKVSDESIDRSVIVDGSAIVEAEAYTASSVSDAVVIQPFGDGEKCLAYMNYQGAYVDYELNVTDPGIYNVALVTSFGYKDAKFMPAIQILHDEAPDANWSMITCKRTCLGGDTAEAYPGYPAGWYTFEALEPLTLALPEGKCILRLECTNGTYPNVDRINLEKIGEYVAPYHEVSGATVIPAIDFNATSRTGDYPVRIEEITAGNLTGDYCLCFMNYPGNAVTYYLDVETAGEYDICLSAANGRDAFDMNLLVNLNGEDSVIPMTIPSTRDDGEGGTGNRWHNFVNMEPFTLNLKEGVNALTLTCETQDKFPNLYTIEVAPAAAPAKLAMVKSVAKSAPAAQADGPMMLVDVYNAGKDENGEYILMDEFLTQMSVEDLIELASAQGNRDAGNTQGWGNIMEYGIPLVMTADGPQGIRISTTCTAWPISTCLSSSWDVDVVAAVGKAAATEAHNNNMDIWLAPGMNIHRDPLCGRNFEYYSEDPLITGKMAASITRATQAEGVAISLKHFAANNKETNRSSSDSRMSERALREIYLKGFEIAVKEADPWTIMSSYNYINGTETAENRELLMGIARGEWGYDGVFETDWGNNSNHVREMLAGNNIKMTNSQRDALLSAYNSGTISRELLEENATYVLELIMKVNYFLDRYVNIPIVDIDATTNFKAAENILWSSTARGEETSDTDGGMNLGYCDAGAYTQYEINVLTGGTYNLSARVASSAGNGAFNMLIDGEVVASFDVPNTGAYQNWVTIQANDTTPVEIAAGRHTLRFEWTESGSNLNWILFNLQDASGEGGEGGDIDNEDLNAAIKAAEAAQAAAEAAQAEAEAAQAAAEEAQAAAEAAAAVAAQDKAAAEAAKAASEAAKAQADAAKAAAEAAQAQAQAAADAADASNTAAAAEAAKAAEEALKAATSATTAAGSAADAAEAAKAAQDAQAAAEAAQAAAKESADSAAADKTAAEAAQAAAELAQAQAEAAKAAAEDAKAAADASAEAAAASNTAAAAEAAKAAEEALKAAESATTAAGSAADAAEAAENAQTAQAAAEEAQAAAEEAAASAAEDKSAAEAAQAAAELAKDQAEAAKAAAEDAKAAADASAEAAANSNAEAAAQAAVAAAEAKKAAASATAAAGSAKDAADASKSAQDAQDAAEAAQAAAEEAAASAADDKTAAEAAQANAELAKAQAVAAKTAAETAQNAAEIAAAAAKEANVEAAEEAAKSAASAKESAESASDAAGYAKDAADAAKAAQDAQAAAEKAAKDAAADKDAAEKAKLEALKAEEEAKKAAAEVALNLAKFDALVELNELSAALQAAATPEELPALIEATAAARTAIKEATSIEAVEAAVEEAEAALNAALCPSKEFSDVDVDAWYHEAVDFVLAEGMMQGTGNGLFAPDAALSRAMLVQILYNIEGRPAYETELSFTDVAEGAWYYDAVMWAAENGIVLGVGDGTSFAPDANVTREQMVTILYRYAESPEVAEAELTFADAAEVSDWALTAVAWAAENGVVQGVGDNMFAPKDNTTRAATAQVCMNYFGK